MIHILAICASILGFGCLCAAMARHQNDLLGRTLPFQRQRWLRKIGGALLLVALAINMAGLGTAYGAIAWFGHLTIGAAMAVAGLKWKTARRSRHRLFAKPLTDCGALVGQLKLD